MEPSATKQPSGRPLRLADGAPRRQEGRYPSLVPLSGAEDELLAQGPGAPLAVVNAEFDTGIPPARQDEVTLVTA